MSRSKGAFSLAMLLGMIVGWEAFGLVKDKQRPTSKLNETTSGLILQRMPSLSQKTQAGIQAILTDKSVSQQAAHGLALAEGMIPTEIERLLDRLHLLPAHSVRSVVKRQLLHRWLETEPEKAMNWALANWQEVARPLVGNWYRRDPEAAVAFAQSYPWPDTFPRVFGDLAYAVADDGIEPTLQFLSKHFDPRNSYHFKKAIEKLAQADPQGVLARLDEFPSGIASKSIIVSAWAKKDARAALAWALNEGNSGLIANVIQEMKDLNESLAALATLTPEQQEKSARTIFGIRHQPEELLTLLEDQSGLTDTSILTLKTKAEEALAPKEPAPAQTPKTTEDLAEIIHANTELNDGDLESADINALTMAIAALPSEEATKAHLALIRRARAAHLHEMAAAQVPYLSDDDSTAIEDVSRLSAAWAHFDPPAATAWVESLPKGEIKTWAARNAAKQWGRLNQEAAKEWLGSLPEGIAWDAQD